MRMLLLAAVLLGGCASSRPYTFGERPAAAAPERPAQRDGGALGNLIVMIVGFASPKTVH
jgi:hypothetical protein